MQEIGFGELVGRMVWGTSEPDSVSGVIRTFDDEEGGESWQRVTRSGFFTREETLDGQVELIIGPDAKWYRDVDDRTMRVRRHDDDVDRLFGHAPIGGLSVGGHRPSWERWEGNDFTRPASPVEATTLLGRDCYTVELAPPSHKPYPLRITVDASTGLVLRKENVGFRSVTEWTEATIGEDLSPDTFIWSGPALPVPSHAERREDGRVEWEAERAGHYVWLAGRGLTAFHLPIPFEFGLHEHDDDTGSIYASIDARFSGTLLRRRTSDDDWAEPHTVNYLHNYRWSDQRWDWYLATDQPVSVADLTALKVALRTTT